MDPRQLYIVPFISGLPLILRMLGTGTGQYPAQSLSGCALGIMADKVKSIDEVVSTANSLRATVSKVFQNLATNPSVNKETGDSSETSKGGNITQILKKNLTSVHKVLR